MVPRADVLVSALMLALLAASLLAVPGAVRSDEETSGSGQFTLSNAAPSQPAFTLYEEDESTTTTQMAPQQEYALKITASDPNGYDDIETIKYYSTTTDGSAEPPAGTSPQEYALYTWTKGSGWSLTGPSGSTWGIDTAQSRGPENPAGTTADWWLRFKPGKVATETAAGTWYIKVEVYDEASASSSNKAWGYTMNWYGEIAVASGDEAFDFGIVGLGDADKGLSSPSDGNIDLYVVSNGNYKIRVKAADSSGTNDYWIGQSSGD